MKSTRIFFTAAIAAVIVAAFIGCGSLSGGASGKAGLPQDQSVVTGTLANGMSYLVAHNSEPGNRLFLRLAVKAGAILEDDDQKGVAHLVEHMAFNGTTHFARNELVNYFESIGMSFGPEVNAYTGFDQTVYMLEIPADDLVVLRKSMQVLQDWASAITFDEEELDKERGVVIEEWRLGRGAAGRTLDKEIPFLFNGSRYAERLPIGDPEIVKSVPRDRVVDFYRKWYRPELMSVIVVGAADTALVLNEIDATLAQIPASAKKTKRPEYPIKGRAAPDALVIRDPEIQYTTVQLLEQHPAPAFATEADLRASIVQNVAYSIFNARLAEKTLVADPAMLAAQGGAQRFANPVSLDFLAMVPANGKFEEAFKQLLVELARLEEFGATEAELGRAKQNLLDDAKQTWLDREKIHSATRANDLLQAALYGDAILSAQARYDLYNRIVPEITLDEIARAIGDWYSGRGKLLLVTAPESATDIPDDAALMSLWQNWRPETALTAYSETGLDRPLYVDSGARGSIVSETTAAAVGIKEWTLSNGAHVIVYPTAYKANEVLFSAWSKGGTSLVSDEDYPSAAVATSYALMSGLNGFSATELQKKLSGKTVSASIWIDESWEGLYGSSSVEDLETLFRLVNLRFTAPYFTDDAWRALDAQLVTVSGARKNDPAENFADMKARLLYGDTIRRENLTERLVAAMEPSRSEAAYRARFADAGDFTFAFVGSLDEAILRNFVETYLAALPSNGTREDARPLGITFPSGVREDTLHMGIDPKSRVFIAFGGVPEIAKGDFDLFSMMNSLLSIRLREVIREDMSGAYGVQVNGSLSDYPEPSYEIRIEFGCEPAREDELAKAVAEQIAWMRNGPIGEEYITKLRENWRRTREEGLKNNGWWIGQIAAKEMRGRPLDEISNDENVLSLITAERMSEMARRYLPEGNYVRAYLMPKE